MTVILALWRLMRRLGTDQVGVLAAGVAYYALLAAFPAIAALVAVAGIFTDPADIVAQLENLSKVIPEEAARILISQAVRIASLGSQGLSLTAAAGFAFALYLLTMAVTALVHGINVAHEVEDQRSIPVYWATVIGLTICLALGTVLMFVLLVLTPAALAYLPDEMLTFALADWLRVGRWSLVALIILLGIALLYRLGPAIKGPRRILSTGAVLAAGLWFAGSYGFSIYVANFANYNASFGSLGGVVILLTWLWLSAYIVILGAMLDREIERSRSMGAP